MKRAFIAVLALAVILTAVTAFSFSTLAADLPFDNLFKEGFNGYTSDEGQILTSDFVSSGKISVSAGETLWFGPCEPAQYFHLVGFAADGTAVTGKIRGKDLEKTDEFANGTVIYRYTVPADVASIVISAPSTLAKVYTAAKTEITELTWRAYWAQKGQDVTEYVGQSSYYEVSAGDKLYFGAITEADALGSVVYNDQGAAAGSFAAEDLRLVESFGGEFGIYCYTVPADSGITYVRVNYDTDYEQYYSCVQLSKSETASDESIVSGFIAEWGIPQPLESTVAALSGKTALFLGDSITYGARDRANIYEYGGWAGRIGYYAGMDVTNNGVSGACISTAREESNSEAHYIYNNLVKTQGTTYDYVIMHGLFNDASEGVEVGTMQGKANFDPAKADVTTYAGGLELLFYQARVQNPDAILGFIVNFHTERTVDQAPYVEMAIKICEDWGIEYLDLYNRSGFSVEFDDGLHPSSAGYDSMYTIVANWMAGLDGKLDSSEQTYTSAATVMSYNVYWDLRDDKTGIENRAAKITALIRDSDPDILLLQEAHADWVSALKENGLTGYEAYGYCHKQQCALGKCSHEMTPILWKTAKYDLVDSGYIHVEDGQYAADGVSVYPRTINWVVLKDKTTGEQLLVMNYHAVPDKDGYDGEAARNATAQLLVQKLDELRTAHGGIPAVLGGDCNMSMTSTAYYTMVGNGCLDVRYQASVTESIGSYNAWTRTDESKYSLGDYVFVTEGMGAASFDVVSSDWADDAKTMHLSDHCPIVVSVKY